MDDCLTYLHDMVLEQEDKLMKIAEKIRPNITTDDLLQPCDYPELEFNPLFRHEEGILEGLKMAYIALRACSKSL